MQKFKTNKLNIQFNFEKILQDFSIVKFSTSEKYIKNGALILDDIKLGIKAKSIVFEKGKSFFALFEKKYIENTDLVKKLETIDDGDKFTFKFLNKKMLKEEKEITMPKLAQLLINSIATPKNEKLSFNNLTGKLYLLNKITKSEIIALEIHIDENFSLQLKVKTFNCILNRNKMQFKKNKFEDYPKYTLSVNTLRRIIKNEKIDPKNQFILKQILKNGTLKKNNIPFLNFSKFKEFENSKMGILCNILDSIKTKLSNYLTIEFNKIETNKSILEFTPFKFENFNQNIFLIDVIENEESANYIKAIKIAIAQEIKNAKIKIVKKENKDGFNIKLIHNKKFYKKNKQNDLYKSSYDIQHISIEDFKVDSKASIKNIIKELKIKNDIKNNQISIIDWKKFNFKKDWIFVIKKADNIFLFLTITPSGKTIFEEHIRNLFNLDKYEDLCSIFNNNKNTEFLVKDDRKNINIIIKTNNFTLPEYEQIYEDLKKENAEISISKIKALEIVQNIFTKEKCQEIEYKINQINDWTKENLLNCFTNRADKQNFTEKVKEATAGKEILKTYLRNENTKRKFFGSQLGIHSFKENIKENGEEVEKNYYFVGLKNNAIKTTFAKAVKIREIKKYKKSEYFFEQLLPLMDVDFVKNGDLTVSPFPIKYLREWNNIYE